VTFAPTDPAASASSSEQPAMTAYGTPSPFGSSSAYSNVLNTQRAGNDTLWTQNQYAVWTFCIAGLYLIIVIATGAGFIGILPAFTAYQSNQRGEPLAPVAVGIAAIGVIVGVLSLTNAF
jgi:hypothetical protein